jgi:hypothetical protein
MSRSNLGTAIAGHISGQRSIRRRLPDADLVDQADRTADLGRGLFDRTDIAVTRSVRRSPQGSAVSSACT